MTLMLKRFMAIFVLLLASITAVHAQVSNPYLELEAFVTNFGEVQSGPLRFLKAEVTLHVAEGGNRIDLEKHKAQIRNDLIFLFKSQKESDLATVEAQTVLAQRALKAVQDAMTKETGHPQVDDLFFTSLVIQ